MKEIFRTKSGLNVIYRGEYEHYLVVTDKELTSTPIICMFDGELSRVRNGERKTVTDWLTEFIEKYGAFYRHNTVLCRTMGHKRLEEVLFRIYHGLDFDCQLADTDIRLGFGRPIVISPIPDKDEAALISTGELYDFSQSNIRGKAFGVNYTNNACVFLDNTGISVQCRGARFYTGYDAGLYGVIKAMPNWHIGAGGALKTYLKGVVVPFAEIVWLYHNGLISNEHILENILSAHADMRSKNLEVDHLSGRVENNYPELLAAVPKAVNAGLGNRRSCIKAPYFFLTLFDSSSKTYKVQAGLQGYGWSRQFAFGDLTDAKEAGLYTDCFRKFIAHVKQAGCISGRPSNRSIYHYWSEPFRMRDKNNPLVLLRQESDNMFDNYTEDAFSEMPLIA